MRNISQEQVLQRLSVENPWWNDGVAIPYSELTPRPYLDLFFPMATNRALRRAVVLLGPRRVGKTVILFHAIKKLLAGGERPKRIFYVSVEHPLYNGLGLEQLLEAYASATGIDYKTEPCTIFFDEIQYLRDWEVHLKKLVDSYPHAKFVASGSAAAALRLKSSESGAGRFTDFLLPPLTFHEYLMLVHQATLVRIEEGPQTRVFSSTQLDELNAHFIQYLNFGGYPEVVLSPDIQKDPARFVKSDIIDKVLLRDLPSLYGIDDIQELNSLFTTLAFNTANEISLDGLSQGSGVTKTTIKKYIEYLQAAFLIRVVDRVDRGGRYFKRANFFKVYLTNPSMRSALFSIITADDPVVSDLVETAIFAQWFHSDARLHYARWDGGEVDMVHLEKSESVNWAVEVKWTDRYYQRPEELKALLTFCHSRNLSTALVTTRSALGDRTIKSVDLEFRPASLYCFTVGYEIIHGKKIQLLKG